MLIFCPNLPKNRYFAVARELHYRFFILGHGFPRKKSGILMDPALKSGNESNAIAQTDPKIVFGKFQGSARSIKLTAGTACTTGAHCWRSWAMAVEAPSPSAARPSPPPISGEGLGVGACSPAN